MLRSVGRTGWKALHLKVTKSSRGKLKAFVIMDLYVAINL